MTIEHIEFEAIDELTRQSEYGGLCTTFVAAIERLGPGAAVRLLEAYDDRGYTSWFEPDMDHLVVREFPTLDACEKPVWLAAALARAREMTAVEILSVESVEIICFGVLNGMWRFIEIGNVRERSAIDGIRRLATIFGNLMALIDRFERDPLTGLLNRQSFDHRFEEVVEYHQQNPRRKRTTDRAWLAITDIDHFKRINDSHGHLFGDEILLLVSQIMRQSFRFDDLLFRYGGEEFIIILNNADNTGAAQALERFRAAIQAFEFPRIEELTVSIGWTEISDREFSSDVIHKSDEALYYAKSHGRNQVVMFEEIAGTPNDAALGS